MKISKLEKSGKVLSFLLNEVQFVIEDTDNIKLSHHDGRYKNGFYMLRYHGVLAFLDKASGDKLIEQLELLKPNV